MNEDFHLGDIVRHRRTGTRVVVTDATTASARYYDLVECPHVTHLSAADATQLWDMVGAAIDVAHPDVTRQSLGAVVGIHQPVEAQGAEGYPDPVCDACDKPWPCSTVKAIAREANVRVTMNGVQYL